MNEFEIFARQLGLDIQKHSNGVYTSWDTRGHWAMYQKGLERNEEIKKLQGRVRELEDVLNHLYHFTSVTTHQMNLIDEVGCGNEKE